MVQRGRGQLSDDRWHEIRPHLWMGGHITGWGERVRPAVVRAEFDLVLSLYRLEGHGPAPGVEHHVAEMPDGPLTQAQLDEAARFAVLAAEAVRAGRSTLVRCHVGYNRSGLVVAQALVELGMDVSEAIALVREKRSPRALHNEVFVRYLERGMVL